MDLAKIVTVAQGSGHKMAWLRKQKRGEGEVLEIYKLL